MHGFQHSSIRSRFPNTRHRLGSQSLRTCEVRTATAANDPGPSATALRGGHKNRLMPPFSLRQRGALNLLRLNAYNRGQESRTPAVGRCGRPPALNMIHTLIRCSSPPRSSSSTSTSPSSQKRRRSSICDARLARACPRLAARARPRWRRRARGSATISVRRSPLSPKIDA